MKFILCLTFLFSGFALAGYSDQKPELDKYCSAHAKDPKKVTRSADGKLKLTPDFVASLKDNKKELNLLLMCTVNRVFWKKFPTTLQSSYEKTTKKKLTTSDLDKLSDKVLELVYNDSHEKRWAAFNAGDAGVEKYYDEKVAMIVK